MPERLTTELFIEKAKIIHKNKYDYSSVKYLQNKIKVIIICPEHGNFLQRPNDHLSGYGCRKCHSEKASNLYLYTNEKFIELAKLKHGNLYDYSLVNYIGTDNKIDIICKKHGSFKQTPHSHLNGSGCPNCRGSIGESFIENILIENNINFNREVTFNDLKDKSNLFYDFYLPDHKTFIEFHGIQHLKPIEIFGGKDELLKLRKRDIIKHKYAVDNGYLLITAWNPKLRSIEDKKSFKDSLIDCLKNINIL